MQFFFKLKLLYKTLLSDFMYYKDKMAHLFFLQKKRHSETKALNSPLIKNPESRENLFYLRIEDKI